MKFIVNLFIKIFKEYEKHKKVYQIIGVTLASLPVIITIIERIIK